MRSSFILLLTAQQFTTGVARLGGDIPSAVVRTATDNSNLRRRTTSYVDDEDTTKLRRRNAASSDVEPPHRYYTDKEDAGLHDGAEGRHLRRMRDVSRDSSAFDSANKDMTGRNKRLSRGTYEMAEGRAAGQLGV